MLNGVETMTYKPNESNYTYIGTIEKSEEDNCLYGKVLDIDSVVLYEGSSKEELVEAFHAAVDDYMELLKENKTEIKFHNENDITIKCNTCIFNTEYSVICALNYHRIYCGINDYGMIACVDLTKKEDQTDEA